MASFHPLIARWFAETFGAPTAPQEQGWDRISAGENTLIAAPTGSGKTLAAFLWSINALIQKASAGQLEDETSVVYISPLKALGNDIQKNLQEPLAAIRKLAESEGVDLPEIRVAVRSGDTPHRERELMVKRPPHILITTPESFFILLTAERSRNFLRTTRTLIVDEIHAVAGDKRGAHLALSLERLDRLAETPVQRIGLSATQKPIDEIARLLVGPRKCEIVDVGHRREWDLQIEPPGQPLGAVATHEMWAEVYERIAELSREHRTTLVFVNTRRLVERVSHQLTTLLGEGKVAAHHGSLSREIRLQAEHGLRSGEVPVVVATASLELGIDIGHVDLVVHLGSPRALATLLQRIGRSGHWLGAIPKGVLFPLTRDDLMQSAAAIRAVRAGELDRIILSRKPLDILAQQIVAMAAAEELEEPELWDLVRRAHPYKDLERAEFEDVIHMLSEGVATPKGRRSAHLHRDQVNGKIRGRRGARLAAITSGGAIPDTADYDVVEEPQGTFVGKVNEDFAIESMAGDIFLLGNTSWRIRRVERGKVRVENAHGAPPSIPFWVGEAPARTAELSQSVSDLREGIAGRLDDVEAAMTWLVEECALDRSGAMQLIEYVVETLSVLGVIPSAKTVVAERFFDEAGGMQLVVHSPFGARINRAWGLSLRKRFCVNFNFELQAAATDDGIVISLGEQHSFPLESVFGYVKKASVQETLTQALLDSPMFTNRWRWNATRSLALLRHSGGKKVPIALQRMRAEDLLAAVFPEQLQCQEHRAGPIHPPDHPLVNETILNCLHEAMDLEGLQGILSDIEGGRLQTVAVETPVPSAMSHEILNSNPYAFLDDAPLEERRARAVALRRSDPDLARGVGALDQSAIDEVRAQAWPDIRSADELHDHLMTIGLLGLDEAEEWADYLVELKSAGRVVMTTWGARPSWAATEWEARLTGSSRFGTPPSPDEAVRQIVHGWMQSVGPVTAPALAERIGLSLEQVEGGLASLEGLGAVLRGRFTPGSSPGATELEWCDRALLSRIHRLTVESLRAQIEPVSAADFMRFLFRWQHLHPGTQVHGRDGLVQVISQLQGLELPAPAWEERVLPARMARYDPAELEYLCLSGVVAWGRLHPAQLEESSNGNGRRRHIPARNTPIGFVLREDLPFLMASSERHSGELSTAASDIAAHLENRGASFLGDIVKATGRLPTEVEDALWELVSRGLVSGDGIAGLRSLLNRNAKTNRRHPSRGARGRLRALPGASSARARVMPVGRWALWGSETEPLVEQEKSEAIARQLLRRYGVVLRELLAREKGVPPWRELLSIYRRWEAQGEIRGGRFVAGFIGEQFALPEAVEALRDVRRKNDEDELVIIPAADPLNLVGIVLPGDRISVFSGLAIAHHNGAPSDIAPVGTLRARLANRSAAQGA